MGKTTHSSLVSSVIISLFLFPLAFASTGPSSPGYVAGPVGRGTIGLITTCLITLSLCVWTAIHMNVPGREIRRSYSRRFAQKLSWALLAVFAPEVVVWRAFDQFIEALNLGVAINEWLYEYNTAKDPCQRRIADEKLADTGAAITTREIDPVSERGNREKHSKWFWRKKLIFCQTKVDKGEWSLAMAFFAVMGGFEVWVHEDYSSLFRRFSPPQDGTLRALEESTLTGLEETTLTSRGVLFMAKIAFVSQNEGSKLRLRSFEAADLERIVRGKSKADSLAKALVCVQGLWMISQTIARKASGLPVTLIEFYTSAHVCCALMLYLTWWYKPQDIQEPEVVEVDPPLAAYLSFDVLQSYLRFLRCTFRVDSAEKNESRRGKQDGAISTAARNDISGDHIVLVGLSTCKTEPSSDEIIQEKLEGPNITTRGQPFPESPFIVSSSSFTMCPPVERRMRLLTDLWQNQAYSHWRADRLITFDENDQTTHRCYKASNISIMGNIKGQPRRLFGGLGIDHKLTHNICHIESILRSNTCFSMG